MVVAGLVDEIYKIVGSYFADIEREAYEREQYDATLDLLEQKLVDRTTVRLARIQLLGCISFMSMQPSAAYKTSRARHRLLRLRNRWDIGIRMMEATAFSTMPTPEEVTRSMGRASQLWVLVVWKRRRNGLDGCGDRHLGIFGANSRYWHLRTSVRGIWAMQSARE